MRLTIERLGRFGDGIGPGAVAVPGALPGEVVEGDLRDGALHGVKIVTPSPQRVRPPCPHARTCGGCTLQHAEDGLVAGWKEQVIRAALAGQGLEAPLRPIATSPARSRRRAVLAGRRLKSGALLGFHGRASGTLVAVPECHLLYPDLMAAFPALKALVDLGASRRGELALTVTRSLAGPDVAVTGGKAADAALRADLGALAERFALARLTWEGEVVALRATPAQQMGAARVVPPPGAFLQATAHGEKALLSAVSEAVSGARRIGDLFAGCGTFTLPLAAGAEVHAVEGSRAMLDALDHAWRGAAGLHRVTTEARDLFRRPLLAGELRGFDAVVIDPPRAGAEAQVAQLAQSRVPVIAMVSCNPLTFARDARALVAAGYALEWVQPVDQFRWSAHVELAARFARLPR